MNKTLKKTLVIILALALTGILFFSYNKLLRPKAEQGKKQVSIRVINEKNNIDRSFEFESSKDYLLELIQDEEARLGAQLKESNFGPMLVSLLDYRAEDSLREFYHISINGQEAMTGLKDIALKDGDIYSFQLKNY